MYKMKVLTRKAVAFLLCAVMLWGNLGGVANAAETDVVDNVETMAEGYDEVELNRRGGLVTTYYPAYEMMTFSLDQKAALKATIKESLDQYANTINIADFGISKDNSEDFTMLREVIQELLNSDWRYFYLTGAFSYSYSSGDGVIKKLILRADTAYSNDDNSLNVEAIQEKQEPLEERVEYALSYVDDDMTDLEKALVLHDFLVTACDYDYDNYLNNTIPEESYGIWGTLMNELAVCQGYSETYSALLREVGIDSVIVSSDAMNHAWNMLYIDGNWYHVDVTWDDPVWPDGYTRYSEVNNDYADLGFVTHTYFLKSDNEFLNLEHSGWGIIVEATDSDAFDGYIFDNTEIATFMYKDGYWHFIDPEKATAVYRAKIDGTDETHVSVMGTAMGSGMMGDTIYYADDEAVYSHDLNDNVNEKLVDIETDYPGYVLTEFIPRYDTLRAVLYNKTTKDFEVAVWNVSEFETPDDGEDDKTDDDADTYVGNVNSELLKFTYDEKTKYISGEIVVVEWVNGESTVPAEKPIMTFESTDGTETIEVFVTATGTNTYYFDRLLSGGLTEGKEYIFNVTSGSDKNVSEYKTVPIYTGTSSIGSEGELGTVNTQKVCFKTQENTGYLLVYGDTVEGAYWGQVNSQLSQVSCVTSENGNFVSGEIVIVEWVGNVEAGETQVSQVPTTTPEMTFESVDGMEKLPVFMASINGTNTFYFDRNLSEDMDVNKEYIFRITLTDEKNISTLKSMVATTNYMKAKEGTLWETATQVIKYKTVPADGDNQLRIYAVNK